ncbi:hypothetical protein [Arthrobacter monumenti]
MVASQRQPHIYNAEFGADRAANCSATVFGRPIYVNRAAVIVGAKNATVKEVDPRIAVVTQHQLLRWLTRRPTAFSPQQLERITAGGVQPGTWRKTGSPWFVEK